MSKFKEACVLNPNCWVQAAKKLKPLTLPQSLTLLASPLSSEYYESKGLVQ